MQSTIHFYGGTGTVTGSNFLFTPNSAGEDAKVNILIDCGLFQGKHSFEDDNWNPFPFDPKNISTLVVTHAHIDHIGRIPKLVKDGFRGTIISTEATKALAEPLLLDAMELSGRTALKIGKEPLYTEKDIAQAMRQWRTVPYHTAHDVGEGISLEFLNAGHILGSAMARFTRGDKTLVFTGDLGGGNSPLLSAVETPVGTNYLVMESVYGNRTRPDDTKRRDMLEKILEDAVALGGTLLIPAFSTERTQDLLFEIRSLYTEKRVTSVPVYIDSPLAQRITDAYLAHPEYFSADIEARVRGGEKIFSFPELQIVEGREESEKIRVQSGPKIIIAGSGMSNGGRVVGHEAQILPDEKSTLLIVGYQSAGSLGRQLLEGAKIVTIHGEKIPVRCKVVVLYGYSAHMDGEQLLEFVNAIADTPEHKDVLSNVFVVMGEPAASSFLVQRIRDYLGVRAVAPESGDTAEIDF